MILDNASIHGSDTYQILNAMLITKKVRLKFLLKYSPELNPCELIFVKIKHIIRNIRTSDNFIENIAQAFQNITEKDIFAFYKHCLINPQLIF